MDDRDRPAKGNNINDQICRGFNVILSTNWSCRLLIAGNSSLLLMGWWLTPHCKQSEQSWST